MQWAILKASYMDHRVCYKAPVHRTMTWKADVLSEVLSRSPTDIDAGLMRSHDTLTFWL